MGTVITHVLSNFWALCWGLSCAEGELTIIVIVGTSIAFTVLTVYSYCIIAVANLAMVP